MTSQIFTQLNAEWELLSTTDVSSWSAEEPSLVQCTTADEVLSMIPRRPNQVLLFLVQQTQAGNSLAGRIVVQTMIGKLIRMSNSGRARSIPTADVDLVASLWERIATLPLTGTLNNVAARLALDTLNATQQLWNREEISWIAPEVAAKLHIDSRPEDEEDPVSGSEVLAMGEQWMEPEDAEVLRLLYGQGASVAEAATMLDVSPQKVYRRRKVGLSVLREHANDCLAA